MSCTFLIVEDHLLFAEALSGLIEGMGAFRCVSIVTNGHDLMGRLEVQQPDIILMDLNLNDVNGIALVTQIRKAGINTPVLVVSMLVDPMVVMKALESGANGFVPKNTSMEELKAALNALLAGERYISADLKQQLDGLDAGDSGKDVMTALQALSSREIEILALIARGMNNKEISETLFISPLTVKTHRANIIRKLDLKNTAAIVHFASKAGII